MNLFALFGNGLIHPLLKLSVKLVKRGITLSPNFLLEKNTTLLDLLTILFSQNSILFHDISGFMHENRHIDSFGEMHKTEHTPLATLYLRGLRKNWKNPGEIHKIFKIKHVVYNQ